MSRTRNSKRFFRNPALWLFVLLMVGVAPFIAFAQQSPTGAINSCTNNDSNCNVGISWYYSPGPTNSPFPLVSASAAYQNSVYGKFTEIDDPNTVAGVRGHFVYGTGTAATAWQPALAEFNLQTNAASGAANIDTAYDTSTSGQIHDYPGLIPGPNGENLIFWGAISQVSKTGQFGSSNGTATGTVYAAHAFKVVLPTASPSAVAAATLQFYPEAAAVSELWSTCWRRTPGVHAYTNETMTCIFGGQAQKCKCFATNGGQVPMGNNQAGGIIHWTSTVGDFFIDTAGTPSPSPPPSCSTAGLTKCSDPTVQAIGQQTNGQVQFTATPGDNDWRAWQIATVTTSTAGSYAFPTLPNNGEFNAATGCTVSFTTGGTETVAQLVADIASMFNSHTLITGNTPGADTANCIAQRVNYAVYVSTASTGKSNTCTAANPCLVLRLKGQQENTTNCAGTFTTNCDITTAGYQLNLPGAATCTSFCTTNATMSIGNTHPTLFSCKLLPLYGQKVVCPNDVDHMTTGFNTSGMSGTGYGDAILCWGYGPNDYNTATQQLTVGSCDFENGSRVTTTVFAGDHITSNNPASFVSPGLPSGTGATTTAASVSHYLVPNPSSTPTGFVSFNFDWMASQDPDVTSTGYPVSQSVDVTNMRNGNLLFIYAQRKPSASPTVWGSVLDVKTNANDNTFQIDSGSTLAGSGDILTVSVGTGTDGTIYLAVTTASSSAHGCGGVSCIIEYTAPPTDSNSPVFTFLQAVSLGGSASAGAAGVCPEDQVGGRYLLCTALWGPFSSAANSTSLSGMKIYMP